MAMKIAIIVFLFTFIVCALGDFNLTVVHISDFHSHWYEFDENKHDCSKAESKAGKCYGGFARLLTFVRDIRKKEKNVLVLSSGEFFLGNSLHPLHGWKLAHALLPKLELDAMSLSNHDFDSGIFELSGFLYAMKFPILCANMVARNTSFLYSRVNSSVVLDVNGTKVGIVGYIHRHALKKTRNAVSFKFVPEIPVLQEEVSRLESEGVDKIIALGHAGYFTDLEIAKRVKGVDIVMGGDSDIMLFDPGHDAEELLKVGNIHGNYPRVHHQEPETADDPSLVNRTLVLHIPQHGMYVGVLRATFDDNGKIIHESGEPVMLDSSIPQDVATLDFLEYAKGALEEVNQHARLPDESEILGITKGHLDGNPRRCRMFECSLGNFIVDAMLHEFTFHYKNKTEDRDSEEHWGPIDALVFNSGPILRSLEPGYITIRDIVKCIYLGGFIKRAYMSGQQVLDMMEHSVKHYDLSGVTSPGTFLQIAGLKVEYDVSQPPGRRVRSLTIRCRDCGDDISYHPIVSYKTYIIGMPHFMHEGRDGYYDFEDRGEKDMGQFDVILIVDHLRRVYEVEPKLDGRIKFFRSNTQSNSSLLPPLLFGESAAKYNKLNGAMVVPENEKASKVDINTEGKNLDTTDAAVEIKHSDEHERKLLSSFNEAPSKQNNPSNPPFVTEASSRDLSVLEQNTKSNNANSVEELSNFKDKGSAEKSNNVNAEENDINNPDSNENEATPRMKNNEPYKNSSPNQVNLSEISSNILNESQKTAETYDDSSMQEIKILENSDEVPVSNNENTAAHLSKETIQSSKTEEKLSHASSMLNSSKIYELMKELLNSSSEALKSLENIPSSFRDFPNSSDILKKISRISDLKKRSVEGRVDDNELIKRYFELKNNASNFIGNLGRFLKDNLSVSNIDSISEEIVGTSAKNIIEKVLTEFVELILRNGILNDLHKNQTEIAETMNTTASNGI